MDGNRLSQPDEMSLHQLGARLAAGKEAIVQWAGPYPDAALLSEVDSLCAKYGALLGRRLINAEPQSH